MRVRAWLLPAVAVVAAVAASAGLLRADRYLASVGTTAAPEAALAVLVVVLLSSVVLIALLASMDARWSPTVRALPAPPSDATLALLLATIVVAFAALGTVRIGLAPERPFAPPLTVTADVALFVVGITLFALHARALARAAAPYAAISRLADIARDAAERTYPAIVPPDVGRPPALHPGRALPAPRSGYVVAVDTKRLVRGARRANAIITAPAIGAYLSLGQPMLQVHALDGRPLRTRLISTVRLADVRDPRRDVAFGLGLLSDVAVAAIEKDPGVAEAALDRIAEVLGRVGPRPFPTGRFADKEGQLRVVQPVVRFPRLAEIALSDVAVRGMADPRVRERLAALVDALVRRLPPDRALVLLAYAPHPGYAHRTEQRVPVVEADQH